MKINILINDHFATAESTDAFITERLSVDEQQAEALISHYHDPNSLEDLLVATYYAENFNPERKQWFWNTLNKLGKTAWIEKNPLIFFRAIYLCWRLDHSEANHYDWQPWFSPLDIQWHENMDDKTIEVYTSALWLLSFWQIKAKEDRFWQEQLEKIVPLLPKQNNLVRPFKQVIDAMGGVPEHAWDKLFFYGLDSKPLRDLVSQYLTIQFVFCYSDAAKSEEFFNAINNAIVTSKSNGKGDLLKKLLTPWIKSAIKKKPDYQETLEQLIERLKPTPKYPPWKQLSSGKGRHTSSPSSCPA